LVLEGLILAGPKIAHHCQPPELTWIDWLTPSLFDVVGENYSFQL
jgi:hypothetical protein